MCSCNKLFTSDPWMLITIHIQYIRMWDKNFFLIRHLQNRRYSQFVITHQVRQVLRKYEGHLESKERFAIKKYLLIIGKKKNMQVLSHTFTYFST